jgi:hypothetical protein
MAFGLSHCTLVVFQFQDWLTRLRSKAAAATLSKV